MADFYGTTTSEGGVLKESSVDTILNELDKYGLSEINVSIKEQTIGDDSTGDIITQHALSIWGYDVFEVYDSEYDDDQTENFLADIQPHLKTPLVISCAGSEKCRYVSAWAWIVPVSGEIQCTSLDNAIDDILKSTEQ